MIQYQCRWCGVVKWTARASRRTCSDKCRKMLQRHGVAMSYRAFLMDVLAPSPDGDGDGTQEPVSHDARQPLLIDRPDIVGGEPGDSWPIPDHVDMGLGQVGEDDRG